MKYKRLFWILSILICVSLSSCKHTSSVRIESVTVSPKSGSGPFSATVKFSEHNDSDEIRCVVTGSSGNEVDVKTISIEASDGLTSADFTFQSTELGDHSLVCTDSINSERASFTVISELEAQANSPLEKKGTGKVTVFFSNGISCPVPAKAVALTVNPDDSATLRVDYPKPDFDCTPDANDVISLAIFGTADRVNGTVNFTSCDLPSSTAQGKLTNYASGALSGEVTCTLKNGQPAYKVTMP